MRYITSFLTNRALLKHLALVLKLYYNSRITSCEVMTLKNKMLTLLVSIVTKGIRSSSAGVGCDIHCW